MEPLQREIIMKEQIRSLITVAEEMKQHLEEVSKLGKQFLSGSTDIEFVDNNAQSATAKQMPAIARKQKSHQLISCRSPTPVALNISDHTTSSVSTEGWIKTPPMDVDSVQNTRENNGQLVKQHRELVFPPWLSKPIAGRHSYKLRWDEPFAEEWSAEESPDKIRSKSLNFCPTVAEQLDSSSMPEYLQSSSCLDENDWRCRYLANNDIVLTEENYLQTMISIDNEVLLSSLVVNDRTTFLNAIDSTDTPASFGAMDMNDWKRLPWKCLHEKDPNQSTMLATKSVLEATNKDSVDSICINNALRSIAASERSALSLLSVDYNSIEGKINMRCRSEKKKESTWLTVESEYRSVTKSKVDETGNEQWSEYLMSEAMQQPTFSEERKSENKETVVQKNRGRLVVLGKSSLSDSCSQSVMKRCKHLVYCILCGRHFQSKSKGGGASASRKVVKNGIVRQLVARWEKFHSKQHK